MKSFIALLTFATTLNATAAMIDIASYKVGEKTIVISADRDKSVRQFKIGDDVFVLDSVGSAFMPWAGFREINPPVNGQEAESVTLQVAPPAFPQGLDCQQGQGLLLRQMQTSDQSKAQPTQWICVDIIKAK